MKSVAFKWNIPECHVVSDFYDDPGFISAYADLVKESLQGQQIDQLILSYHGLPERHIKKSECQAACDMLHACPQPADLNAYCYRAQCYRTSALLAALLGNMPYQVAFQSRLGQTPWIKPYTDHILPELARKGVKSIAVACPSFVADCLETLEEVNMRLREQWSALGGQAFHFIPCLNSRPSWVQAMAAMIRNRMA
jgi:ferrochelatase